MRSAIALIALLLAMPAAAQTVVDGDTIKLNGTAFRLHGIDAPETNQACADGWPAGRAALTYLRELMQDKAITCEPRATDRYGRTVALCRADGVDLGGAMVSGGHALAFTQYSAQYIAQESAAKAAGRGLHAHECLAPWMYRTQQRTEQRASR